MKKIKYIAFLFGGVMLLQSCFKEDDEAFPTSASERMEARLAQTTDTLIASEYGWTMDYYPDQTVTEGGYTYVMQFKEDNIVSVGYELAGINDRVESVYQLLAEQGPILTFNTYNEYMHHFASPSSQNYNGLGGDYEFVIMKIEPSCIVTQGKKTENTMKMFKLVVPASEYLTQITQTKAYVNNFKFTLSDGVNDVMLERQRAQNVFIVSDTTNIPYVYTDKGIRFGKPINVGNTEVDELVFSDNKQSLIGTGSTSAITMNGMAASDCMLAGMQGYVNYSFDSMSSDLKNQYDRLVSVLSQKGMTLKEMSFVNNKGDYALYVGIEKNRAVRQIYYSFDLVKKEDGSIALTYKSADQNGKLVLGYDGGMQEILDMFDDKTFSVSSLNGSLNHDAYRWESGSMWVNFLAV